MVHNLNGDWMYKINGVMWSIAIEWQLYLIFPLLVALMFRVGRTGYLALTTAVALLVLWQVPDSTKFYVWYLPLFGLGMAASANLHPGRTSMFEPVHGSAPALAGRDLANPCGAVLSTALLLETLGMRDAAALVERSVRRAVDVGAVTPDVGGTLGTREAGDAIAGFIRTP
jgi:peptidoglycan/LPS O-acetylase OafA/YrhL